MTNTGSDSQGPGSARVEQPLILLVDEHEIVRAFARHILEEADYRVIEAGSGEKALAAFAGLRGEVAAAVLEFDLPGIDGERTWSELRRLRMDLPAVICSGTIGASAAQRMRSQGVPIVPKPFRGSDLLVALSSVLGGLPAERDRRQG